MKLRVAQCWDDGVESDVRLVELLRKHHAKATFNLNPALSQHPETNVWKYRDEIPVRRLKWNELPQVYAGFTIANHTLTHPSAPEVSLERWQHEVREGRQQLQEHFGQPVDGFAYPFGTFTAAAAEVVQRAGHTYGRTTKQLSLGQPFPGDAGPSGAFATSTDGHFLMADFWQRLEAAKRRPQPVFWFWGHSYELVSDDDWARFDDLIARLSSDPDVEWVEVAQSFR
jgi:peptidoglycan/xylan/chitin deacetylase (PgdA/CDA1 family)